MLETGIVVFITFWLLWIKLDLVTRLRALNHPFMLDLIATASVFLLFGSNTYSGIVAAAMAGIITSINISIARSWYGYIYKNEKGELIYHVGRWNLTDKLHAHLTSTN